ncbi:MAG: hypothetical protein Q4D04_11880 [Clostridia bacterium]|nr:hypothetical protein [Clostridia bacterium]
MKKVVLFMLAALMTMGLAFAEVSFVDEAYEAYEEALFVNVTPNDYALSVCQELYDYSVRIDAVELTVDEAVAANSASRELLRSIDKDCDLIDRDLDYCEDSIEASQRSGAIDLAMFRLLDDELERLDNRLDRIDDTLEYYFNYDD